MPRPSTKIRSTDIKRISSIRGKRKASRQGRVPSARAPGETLDATADVSVILSAKFEISASYISAFRPTFWRENVHRQESLRVLGRRRAPGFRLEIPGGARPERRGPAA